MSARALCLCGCGLPAPIAQRSDPRRGWVKGEPLRFRQGHGRRKHFDTQFCEEDRGYVTSCWIWIGSTRGRADNLYGVYCGFDGHPVQAHRFAFERAGGVIPPGHQLDHLCRMPLCVNPDHLEPVTPAENTRRGLTSALRPAATHCIHGHELTPENTRITTEGHRRCRACHRRNAAASRERHVGI